MIKNVQLIIYLIFKAKINYNINIKFNICKFWFILVVSFILIKVNLFICFYFS